MVLSLLVAILAQGASPSSTVVIVTRRTAVSAADAQALAMRVTKELEAAGVEVVHADVAARRLASLGVNDTGLCGGRKACVQEFGRQLEVAVVVGLSLSEVDQDRSMSLEAVRITDGAVLTRENLLYPARGVPPAEQLAAFSQRTRAALPVRPAPAEQPATPAPAPADSPVASVLTPAATSSPVISEPKPSGPSHTGAWLAGGGAVLAAAAAVALVVLASSSKAELSRGQATAGGPTLSPLTEREALAVSGRANLQFAGAATCAALGLGLGTTAVVLW